MLAKVDVKEFNGLDDSYTLTNVTDTGGIDIALWRDDGSCKTVFVAVERLGVIKPSKQYSETLQKLKPFTIAFDLIRRFDNPAEHEWLPDEVVVSFRPYNHRGKPAEWPAALLGEFDPTRLAMGDSFSLYIDKSHFDELSQFFSRLKPSQPIGMNGKKWAIDSSYIYPSEREWMRCLGDPPPRW